MINCTMLLPYLCFVELTLMNWICVCVVCSFLKGK